MSKVWEPKSRFYYTEDIFLNFEKFGGGNDVLVFLHGFGLSLYSWEGIKPYLDQQKYTCYFLDLKGFGFSYKGNIGDYSVTEQAQIVTAFIKKNNLSNLHLVGHSYGGMVILYMLFQNSLVNGRDFTIKKLVLLDTPAFLDAQPFFLKALRNPILNFISLQILTSRINAISTIRNTFYDKTKGLEKYTDIYEFFFKQPGAKKALTLAAKNIYPPDISELTNFYKTIKIPVLIIWGENDTLIPIEFGAKLQHVLGNAILLTIPECGHVPCEEMPETTALHLNNFLLK